MKKKYIYVAFGVMGTACLAMNAHADSVTANLNVSATISLSQGGCTVEVTPLAFGFFFPGFDSEADSQIQATCGDGLPYTIALDGGNNPVLATARQMSNGDGAFLYYSLASEPGSGAAPWGDAGTEGATLAWEPRSFFGTGAEQVHTVYGRINADFQSGQTFAPGEYTDTVLVTVYF